MSLSEKRIVLGVTGGIAAFRAADLASKLVQTGASVRVVMTRSAREFIRPLTFEALTGFKVPSDLGETSDWSREEGDSMEHLSLADWAEVMIIAPATAHTIARLAAGLADDLLTSTALATRAPVLVAPAMNSNMWQHPATKRNVETLHTLGYHIVEPETGRLACGVVGPGRLADVESLVDRVSDIITRGNDLSGVRMLITAGPTREPLDPVRFVSNQSSGKMGYALAKAGLDRGGQVTLISGPSAETPPAGARFLSVETASQMTESVITEFPACDVFICAAAIADFRPRRPAPHKIKKLRRRSLTVELEPVPDFFEDLRGLRKNQVMVGFAAETQDLESNARVKLERKGLDLIVANDVTQPGAGFGSDTNVVTLMGRGRHEALPLMTKLEAAHRILDAALEVRRERPAARRAKAAAGASRSTRAASGAVVRP